MRVERQPAALETTRGHDARPEPKMSVILTGFMGTGKTTVGQRLAQRLGKASVDTDECIEQLEGRPIAAIFGSDGEAYFRALERRVVVEAVRKDAVVATGGGAIVDPITLARMRAAGAIEILTFLQRQPGRRQGEQQ